MAASAMTVSALSPIYVDFGLSSAQLALLVPNVAAASMTRMVCYRYDASVSTWVTDSVSVCILRDMIYSVLVFELNNIIYIVSISHYYLPVQTTLVGSTVTCGLALPLADTSMTVFAVQLQNIAPTTAPSTIAPGTTAPGPTVPVTTAPGTTAPGTTSPGPTVPVTAAPGTTAPGTTSPGPTVPVTTAPVTVVQLTVRLNKQMSDLNSPAAMDQFKNGFLADVALALEISVQRLSVVSVAAGSVVVKFVLLPGAAGSV